MTLVTKSAGIRQFKNSSAQWLITLGGIGVWCTLILIFLYLLYVVKPIFESAEIEPIASHVVTSTSPILTAGVDELKEVAYLINQQGVVDFYQINCLLVFCK